MKNENMKVSELLKTKSDLEGKINSIEAALKPVNLLCANGYNYKDRGSIRVFCSENSQDACLDRDLLKDALVKMHERLASELEPVSKKLEAIELMLNS